MSLNVEERLKTLFSPKKLQLTWHDNRSSFLSCRKGKDGVSLRLHRLFASAPSRILEALPSYILKGDRSAAALLREMAHRYFSCQKAPPLPLQAKGMVYDLEEIAEKVRKSYFPALEPISIGWSEAKSRSRACRSMQLGVYDRHRNQIRIHPSLDQKKVPLYYLTFLVYHEMLHAICAPKLDQKGRIIVHTAEFRALEKQFEHFALSREWEKKGLLFHGRA
ncbi:MAG: hypothetical protein KGI80_01940 [Verrucomicrobiota bacterium]|nr:hypothetical protein [Verrucomicrobiota bacterium]